MWKIQARVGPDHIYSMFVLYHLQRAITHRVPTRVSSMVEIVRRILVMFIFLSPIPSNNDALPAQHFQDFWAMDSPVS
jgi:hypothetical protein